MSTIVVKDANGANQTIPTESAPGRAAAAGSKPVVLATEDKEALDGLVTRIGEVATNPTANTAQARLKAIADGLAGKATEAKQDAILAALGAATYYPATQPVSIAGTVAVSGPLTDTQLRASALPVSVSGSVSVTGPLTDAQLRATAVPVTVGNFPATQPVSGTVGISGSVAVTGPLTDAQLRATALPVSGTFWQATQPVSVASLPLPTGAALETTQAAINAKLPASLGIKTAANSLSIAPASDAAFALAASETVIGATAGLADVVEVTLTLDTAAYAAGDVLSTTQTLTNAVRINGGRAVVQSITVIDEDDQGQPLDIVFFSATQSMGTINTAVSISDAGARDILGIVPVTAADFVDLGGVRVANLRNVGLMLEAAAASRNLFLATISRGTGTYTAAGIRLRIGLLLT